MPLRSYLKLFCKSNTVVEIKKAWRHVPYLDVLQNQKDKKGCMKKSISILIIALLANLCLAQDRPIDYVNVFTGTSNSRWMLFPGPTMPFGMVKLSPDNQKNVWNGGYEYTISSISGFSHLHGMSLSGVSYMPVVGKLFFGEEYAKLFPGEPSGPFGDMWTSGYRSRFDKKDETGRPGYYSVDLLDSKVKVELTATNRCGMIRATFPKPGDSKFILDFDPPTEELNWSVISTLKKINDSEIVGSITYSNQYADKTTVYFKSKFSKPIKQIDGWQYENYKGDDINYGTKWRRKCHIKENINEFEGEGQSGAVIKFETGKNEKVTISTGISFVSIENAALNMSEELEPLNYDFDNVVLEAEKTWNNLLSRIEVEGKEKDIAKFYTNFYRAFAAKNLLNDVNGQYVDMCEKVRTIEAPADAVYSSDGLWGAHWNLFPFWTLIAPEYANSFANSFLELQKYGGWLPEAPVGLEYAPIMGAQHHNALLISSYQKGISTFDKIKAYNAIKHDYTTQGIEHPCGGYAGNRHLQAYMDLGYVPNEVGPVSNTMEYAYDDWCMAEFASALGNKKDAKYFYNRAMNYKNVYDKETGYIRQKHKNGKWYEDFDAHREGTEGGWNGPGYMEGNAWIYTWYVPHDLNGLTSLLGKETFNSRLEEGFQKGYVNLGNQPNLQAPFLFNYSGKPWLTQYYSRYVAEEFYKLSPLEGWVGEEDEGQMGALYCLISMGLFDMKGGCSQDPYYDLSSPVFDRVVVNVNSSQKPFIITTKNNSEKNVYIQSATWNGRQVKQPTILYKDIIEGGELILHLDDKPNKKNWIK